MTNRKRNFAAWAVGIFLLLLTLYVLSKEPAHYVAMKVWKNDHAAQVRYYRRASTFYSPMLSLLQTSPAATRVYTRWYALWHPPEDWPASSRVRPRK